MRSPARTAFRTLLSLRHTPRPTRTTPTRSSSPTTIPEPPRLTTPAHHSPATAAPPSLASIQAPLQVATGQTLATRLLSTTNLPALSSQFFWLRAAADRASAPGSPLTAGSPGRLALVFTTAALMTASLAGPTTTRAVHSTGGCTFPGTTSLLEGTSRSASRPTTVATWTNERQLAPASPFIRDIQITGDLSGNGTIYVAGMDEGGGGFPHNNINHIYRSTDGGNTWTQTYVGPSFAGPGVTASGYFACMFPDAGGYWRHEGWGEPAAFNNVVHLVYAQHGAGADAGDVYYIRSTDSGVTFSAPFKLNSDATTRPQWQPNISVSPSGTLLATWYDGREFASCT